MPGNQLGNGQKKIARRAGYIATMALFLLLAQRYIHSGLTGKGMNG
jgi:hypothetical protein